MRRWVVLFMIGLLFLSSFGFAGQFQEVKNSQVPKPAGTCGAYSSCQDFNVEESLVEVNARIENLTKVINQKEAELHKLYAELKGSKSIETLEKIIKLEDEIQSLKHELKAFERRKFSLELIKKYTRKTPYGLQVLYYRLPKENELVKQYVEKVNPVRKDVDLDWFIAYFRQAGELTFDEYIETDMKLREVLKEVKTGNATINDALELVEKRKRIWDRIYGYMEERDKLQTLKKLKELGKQQTIMKTIGIEPLAYNFGGINEGSLCLSTVCYLNYGYKNTLPSVHDTNPPEPVYYTVFSPVAVWVGIYQSSIPNVTYFWGEYCTYEFPSTSTDVKKYWDKAVELHPGSQFEDFGSIQVKLFYDGIAYNPKEESYQESNIIWEFNCNSTGCWLARNRPELLSPPDATYRNQEYMLYVYARVLACCSGGDVSSLTCKWANRHCGGCFAPDESASQNFAFVARDKEYWIIEFG